MAMRAESRELMHSLALGARAAPSLLFTVPLDSQNCASSLIDI